MFSSHQTSQAPVPDSEVSHSLIILTFLYNDPMHSSPLSDISSLPPSNCLFSLDFINLVFCSPSLSQWRADSSTVQSTQVRFQKNRHRFGSICTHSGSQLQHQPINGNVTDNNSENTVLFQQLFHQIFSSSVFCFHTWLNVKQTSPGWAQVECFGDKVREVRRKGFGCVWVDTVSGQRMMKMGDLRKTSEEVLW